MKLSPRPPQEQPQVHLHGKANNVLRESHSSSLPALHGQRLGDTISGLPARLTVAPVLRQPAVHAWRALIQVPFTVCPSPTVSSGTLCLIWHPRCPLTTRRTHVQQRAVVTSRRCPYSPGPCPMALPAQTNRGRSRLVVKALFMTSSSDRCLRARIRRIRPCPPCRQLTRTRACTSEATPSPGEARDATHVHGRVHGLHAATFHLSSRTQHDFTTSRFQRRKYLTEPRR